MEEIDFKNILNPSQLEAVNTTDGPLLVVAGAGTGKTRVIEYRVLNLIQKGIKPSSILLLTFTRKAARQMIDRASRHNRLCQDVEGGTFHSFAYKIIKQYKKFLGFKNNISFLDESDSADALHLLCSKLGFLDKKTRFPKKNTIREIISMSINRSQNIRSILENDYPHFLDIAKDLENIHKEYIDYKLSHSLIDYDDMILYLKFLLENKEILKNLSSRYSYVMVDEFQDTNKLQADIVYLLGDINKNVMVVGDDTQSIYSFRGAYYKNMFDFPKRFPDCKILKLERNYRSTQPILDVANAVIEGEKQRYTKVLFTVNNQGTQPMLNFFKNAHNEAEFVANKIKQLYDEGAQLSSVGVLYRSNYHSLPLQLTLSKLDIPFIVYGGIRFIETAHVKDVLSFVKVLHNKFDEPAWNRILMMLEGVGPRTSERICQRLAGANSIEDAFVEFSSDQKIGRQLKRLVKLFQNLSKTGSDISDQLCLIKEFYFPIMKNKFDDYNLRSEDLKALIQISSEYDDLQDFLVDFVALEPPERSRIEISKKNIDEPPLVLSTIHSAKGLEWDAVFIISLIDGCLPVSYAMEDEESIEEERRLLYVAITRAKTKLFLSMHNQGQEGGISSFNRLSRFLNERKVLNKIYVDYKKFENYNDSNDIIECIDVNEDPSSALKKIYNYFDY
jgi:DNA helicase-2/ATP-dependent DNA helicase PcrA